MTVFTHEASFLVSIYLEKTNTHSDAYAYAYFDLVTSAARLSSNMKPASIYIVLTEDSCLHLRA